MSRKTNVETEDIKPLNEYIKITKLLGYKFKLFNIVNIKSKDCIGLIYEDPKSKNIIFGTPEDMRTIWNFECLMDISKYMNEQQNKHISVDENEIDNINIKKTKELPVTNIYTVKKIDEQIGEIRFYNSWKQYCLFINKEITLNFKQVKKIARAIKKANKKYKKSKN